ncbi:MAG TPA: cytidine deaminase [Actinomycetota bacterium]|nr:cytidine deaminase [Actinomycetota bacterium]
MKRSGDVDELVEAARAARANAHAPYSRFGVGAAVLAGDRVFVGVNVENASYPLSVCAERNAVAAAVAAGEREFLAVAVVADDEEPTPPCGGCRQVLHEFGPGMLVVSENERGKRNEWTLADLFPDAFERPLP